MQEIIHLIHTNDFHSHFERWPKMERYIRAEKKKFAALNEDVFLFDIGDIVDRAAPLTEATQGRFNTQMINLLHYDAVTIGNNEGTGNPHEQLDVLYQHTNYDVILSNMLDLRADGQPPRWAQPFKIITTKHGTRLAIIAFTAPFADSYLLNDWNVGAVEVAYQQVLKKIKGQYDQLIVLSHLGYGQDVKLAENHHEIAIILGSHTHHLLPTGERHGHTMVGAAGKFGEHIGEMTLTLENHKIKDIQASVVTVDDLPSDKTDQETLDNFEDLGHKILRRHKVAYLGKDYHKNWFKDSELTQLGLEALCESGKTAVSVLNAGLFMTDLKAGVVSADELHDLLPHPMRPLRVTLSGMDMERFIREMEKNRGFLRKFKLVGMGFRGKMFGEICYRGIEYRPETQEVLWLGKKIKPNQKYTLTTIDHFMFIPFFPTIELCGQNEFYTPKLLREVLGDYLKHAYPLDKNMV